MNHFGKPIANYESFRAEARYQRLCAVLETGGDFLAHHVVYEQDLKRLGLKGNALYDTRNALRLSKKAHDNHHSRFRVVRTVELTDDNVAYAFIALGERGASYLRSKYDDVTQPDPRIPEWEWMFDWDRELEKLAV